MSNTRFSSALHMLLTLLLEKNEAPVSSQKLARVLDTHPVVVRRLVADLRAVDLVVSVRGAGGGVRPGKGLRNVTLGTVARAVDFEPAFDMHAVPVDGTSFSAEDGELPNPHPHIYTTLLATRAGSHAALLEHLDTVTLGELADSANLRTELAALLDKGLSQNDIRQAYRVAGAHLVPKADR